MEENDSSALIKLCASILFYFDWFFSYSFFRKISDEGGGIRRSGLPNIFTYLYSTAEKLEYDDVLHGGADDGVSMAGYGYGLPVSRLYARYFGGDLQIISMEGYGNQW